ncbi:MAG: antitoxin [Candidatus Korarchaeota archaeon]|nr:antitoxin [Candidatus Korarchaeota archaeon]
MSAVIGVRVPKKLKEELEKLEINYSEEIRKFLEDLVRRKRAERIMRRLRELERSVGRVEGNLSVELVREDREGR